MDNLNSLLKTDEAGDYGEAVTYEDLHLLVVDRLTPVRDLMLTASAQYKTQGLTVPIILYEDVIRFATEKLPWCGQQLKAIENNDIRHALVSLFIGEINGFNYMANRLARIRAGRELVVTGSEGELMVRLRALEEKIFLLLDHVISHARHPFWHDFHTQIKTFLADEFPKLYKTISDVATSELREKNIQLLIMDLTHVTLPPL